MNNFNPITCADEVYDFLKVVSDDSVAFDLTISALEKALEKAKEEAAEERRAVSANMAKEAMLSGEVTWWSVSAAPKVFYDFSVLAESMELGFNDGEEVY